MTEQRKALSLAAVLAATVLTGGAAVLGMTRNAPVAPQAAVVQPAAAQSSLAEEGD